MKKPTEENAGRRRLRDGPPAFARPLFCKAVSRFGRLPVFLLLFAAAAYAQEGPPPPGLSPAQNVIEMDIRTSTLAELAAWSRRNGLPEGGTSADLARRLREHYGLPLEGQAAAREGQRIITIESARTTEYFTIQAVDEEYARLSGEVVISLRDGDAVHEIWAWDILFNRTRNIISASGGVEYRRTQGDTIETFRGDSITVDLDNWASIFLGGITERALEGEGATYLFAGTVISRDEEEVTVLRDAVISSVGEDSLWSLTASRVWLLPGSDFAIFNALLRVGEIPVFYIPFFFFPADQMIFHPAIGTRTREGNFVNTTTYLLGRPRSVGGSESSLTRILGAGDDMDRRREGLFLRSTGTRAAAAAGPSLSMLIDYYTNLGAYIGTEMSLPGRGLFGTTDLSMGIGLSRTLAPPSVSGAGYTPFWPYFDGEVDWNRSRIFGTEVPFRYRFRTTGSISGRFGNLSWTIPHYSDPFIDRDFMNRQTTMDWLGMLQQGAAAMEAQDIAGQTLANYSWELRGQIQPRFPDMRPFITNVSIDPITSNLQFRTITTPLEPGNVINNHSPMRSFFAPDNATLYRTRISITGNPLRLGGGGFAGVVPVAEPERENPLEGIGVPISPFAVPEEEGPPPSRDPADVLVPPTLAQRFDVPRRPGANATFGLDYSFTPGSASTLRFDGAGWREFDDVDWGEIRSVLTNFSGSGRIGLNFRFNDNFFVNTFTFSGSGTWQQYSHLNEEAAEFTQGTEDPDVIARRLANARLQQYRQSNFNTTYTVDTNFRPFHRHPVFGASGVRHNMSGLAVRSEFTSTVDDLLEGYGPEWDLMYGGWHRDQITAHQLVGTFGARIMDLNQTLTFTTHLPPRDRAYIMSGTFNVWVTTTTASWGIRFPHTEDRGVHDAFNLTHTIRFGTFGNFSQNLQMDTEDVELTRLTSQLNLTRWGLMFRFRAARIRGFEFVLDPVDPTWGEWRPRVDSEGNAAEPTLRAEDFFIQYGRRVEARPRGGVVNSVFARVDSSITFNLQRYTDSRLTFGIGSGIDTRFMRLSLNATADNNDIFRYFRNWPMFSDFPGHILPEGRQNNIFLDLMDSFRFGGSDEAIAARNRSGFKIRGLTIRAERSLGDWDASLDWRMTPYRPRVPRARVEMQNFVTFMVRWIPISEFRSEIRYDPREDFRTWTVEGL